MIAGAMARPLQVIAQSKQLPKVGILGLIGAGGVRNFIDAMRDLGLIDGRTVTIKGGGITFEGGPQDDQLARAAAELVADKVDVIFASGSQATAIAKNLTSTIPIVTISGDPVGLGFAKSLARPGGNITGLSNLAPDVSAKRLELLKRVVPQLDRVAVFFNPRDPGNRRPVEETEAAGASLALKVQIIAITDDAGISAAFVTANEGHAQAIAVITNPLLDIKGQQIVDLALKSRLPLIGFTESFPKKGALLGYGPSIPAIYRRAAYYVQRVVAGADPAELPIEQPTKFNFVINLKTASALAITIADNLLVEADEVIE